MSTPLFSAGSAVTFGVAWLVPSLAGAPTEREVYYGLVLQVIGQQDYQVPNGVFWQANTSTWSTPIYASEWMYSVALSQSLYPYSTLTLPEHAMIDLSPADDTTVHAIAEDRAGMSSEVLAVQASVIAGGA